MSDASTSEGDQNVISKMWYLAVIIWLSTTVPTRSYHDWFPLNRLAHIEPLVTIWTSYCKAHRDLFWYITLNISKNVILSPSGTKRYCVGLCSSKDNRTYKFIYFKTNVMNNQTASNTVTQIIKIKKHLLLLITIDSCPVDAKDSYFIKLIKPTTGRYQKYIICRSSLGCLVEIYNM